MGRSCQNKFLRLQQDCWRHALAVILLRRIGGTTEDLRDLRIKKTNIEGRMEPFLTCGCMRLRERCIQKRSYFSQKSEPYMNRSTPSLPLPSLSGARACAVVISRASRTSERSRTTQATTRGPISRTPCTL